MTRLIAVAGLLLLVALGAAMAWPDPDDTGTEQNAVAKDGDDATKTATESGAPPEPESRPIYLNEFALDEASLTPEQKANTIVLGNGWRVWALNGCKNTDGLAWSASRSRSPIKRLVQGPKFDYYEHEDGAITTTQRIQNKVTGEFGVSPQHWTPVNLDGVKFDSGSARGEHRIPNAPVRQRPTRRNR